MEACSAALTSATSVGIERGIFEADPDVSSYRHRGRNQRQHLNAETGHHPRRIRRTKMSSLRYPQRFRRTAVPDRRKATTFLIANARSFEGVVLFCQRP